jgi:hypothetical protein
MVSTGRAGFGAALGLAAGVSESSELSLESEAASGAFFAVEPASGNGAGLVVFDFVSPGAEDAALAAGVLGPLAAGALDGGVSVDGAGAGALAAGSGVMLGELEGVEPDDAELDGPESGGPGVVAVVEGLFELEPSHGNGCPFQRKYPRPAANSRAIKIRKTLPALLPRGWSSSSSR